jgi:hypothetical protein
MPPKVAGPAQSAQAQSAAAGMTDVRTGQGGGRNSMTRVRPLTRFERKAMEANVDAVYVYNVSPIFQWQKIFAGLGALTIQKCPEGKPYTDAICIERRLVRPFDGGNNTQKQMVEEPLDIVQDALVCSPDYPMRPENNLTRYGCFYTVGVPIEETEDRDKIIAEAVLNHTNRCLEKVQEADALVNTQWVSCIVEIHRKAALHLQTIGEISELPDWVSRRSKPKNALAECPFCGFEGKPGTPICKNCKEVLDPEKYEALKKGGKKKAS